MTDLDERFRSLNTLPAPDLWSEARERRPGSKPIPSRPSRLVPAVVAIVIAAASTAFVVRAFTSSSPAPPVSNGVTPTTATCSHGDCGSGAPTPSPATGPYGLPAVTVSPDHGPVGTRVHVEGDGFTGASWRDVGATGGGYGVFLLTDEGDCELLAVSDPALKISRNGHLIAEVTVPAQGECFQSGRSQAVRPGDYRIGIGCHACEVADFRVTRS
jgi:hypothetical protein